MKKTTPLKAIRRKCLDCSVTAKEVRLCTVTKCPLYAYRMGRRPKDDDLYPEDVEGMNMPDTTVEEAAELR